MKSIFRRSKKKHRHAAPVDLDAATTKQTRPAERAKAPKNGGLSAYASYEHLIASTDGLWAYYALDEVPWKFKGKDHRAATMKQLANSLYDLTGHRLWWRGLANPFPAAEWASALDRATQGRRIAAAGSDNFDAYLETPEGAAFAAMLEQTQEYIARHGTRKRENVLGVRIGTPKGVLSSDDLALIFGPDRLEGRQGSLEQYRQALRKVNSTITGSPDGLRDPAAERSALSGTRMTAHGMGWVFHASVGMGMPVPTGLLVGRRSGWDEDEMGGFTNTVAPAAAPFARTVELRSTRVVGDRMAEDGSRVEVASELVSHVATLHARVIRDRTDEEVTAGSVLPWLHSLTTMPYDVDFLAVLDVIAPEELEADARRVAGITDDFGKHVHDHDLPVDDVQVEAVQNAMEYRRSVRTDHPEDGTRVRGVVMVAVTGDDEDDLYNRKVAPLVSRARRDARVELVTQYDQYGSYRAFWPGEPVNMLGSTVQMALPVFAAAVPNVDTGLGDRSAGVILGPISGSRDVVNFDLHGGSRRDTSNMVFIAGEQGSGKSKLIGRLAESAVESMAVQTYLNDPSGPAEQLATVPWLTRHTRVIDLASTSAKAGIVTPSVLVPEPQRGNYDNDDEWQAAIRSAEQERREMLRDVLLMLLPPSLVESEQGATAANLLYEAVYEAAGAYGQSPWEVVDYLERKGRQHELAGTIATVLKVESEQLGGRQVFPAYGSDGGEQGVSMLDGNLLTIIKLSGISIPDPRVPRTAWDSRQRASQPLLYLSTRFATRAMYLDKSKSCVFNDEMGLLEGSSSVSSMAARTAVDSRKWNSLVVYGTQNPLTLYQLAPQITNLAGAMFMGKMRSLEAATAALDLLGAPTDQNYQQTLLTMPRGNFIMRDWDQRIDHMLVDTQLFAPELDEATNTTPEQPTDDTFNTRFGGIDAA